MERRWPLGSLAAVLVLLAVAGACAGDSAAGAASDIVAEVPFASGERLVYGLHDDAGELIARGTLTITRDGGGLLVLRQEYGPAAGGSAVDSSVVIVAAESLRPQALERVVTLGAEEERYIATYAPDGASVESVRVRDGKTDRRELRLREHYYDNESSLWLWRTLDLGEGYEARYVSVNNVERSRQTVALTVTSRQTLEVPAGQFDTWRLLVRNGRATRVAWINVLQPHQVVQWDNGSTVFRLESVGELAEASR